MQTDYDETMSQTKNRRILYKWMRKIKTLEESTFFSRDEIERLFTIYYKMTENTDGLMKLHVFKKFCHTTLGITGK